MKSLISITSVNHCDTYNTFSTPLETEANNKLYNFLLNQISQLNTDSLIIHKTKSALEKLKEKDILSYSSYNETSKERSNIDTIIYELAISKSDSLFQIESHRIFQPLDGSRHYQYSISIQVLLHS